MSFDEFREAIIRPGFFVGGPKVRFEEVGRMTRSASIAHGLMPDDRVLDIGAGAMRVGWWLLQYIDPDNYHAIEPNRKRIDTAAGIIGADIHVYYNDDWTFPEEEFDFVLARSIGTHCDKAAISTMLSEFAEHASPDERFLASVILTNDPAEDYV